MRDKSIAVHREVADFCYRAGQVKELVGLFPHPGSTLELAPSNLDFDDASAIVFFLRIGMVFRTTQTRIEPVDMELPESKGSQQRNRP